MVVSGRTGLKSTARNPADENHSAFDLPRCPLRFAPATYAHRLQQSFHGRYALPQGRCSPLVSTWPSTPCPALLCMIVLPCCRLGRLHVARLIFVFSSVILHRGYGARGKQSFSFPFELHWTARPALLPLKFAVTHHDLRDTPACKKKCVSTQRDGVLRHFDC